MSVLPNDYDSDPGRFLSAEKFPHDDVHPYVARRFGLSEPDAAAAATTLDLPLMLTKRGCVVYATKGPGR